MVPLASPTRILNAIFTVFVLAYGVLPAYGQHISPNL